ncbi:MAG TPA: hypothetical protein VF626_08550 [Chthoniobacterales bacterium]
MPQSVGIHQNRMLSGRDEIVAMTIDRSQEMRGGDDCAHTLIEADGGSFVPEGSGFHVFHPAVIFPQQQMRYCEFWPKPVAVHPLQQGEPFCLARAGPWFIDDGTCFKLKPHNRSARVVPIGQTETRV